MARSCHSVVSTHSRLKAAGAAVSAVCAVPARFNTQPPEGGWPCVCLWPPHNRRVSTHSRLKAAGGGGGGAGGRDGGFNTQPPEGGWCRLKIGRWVNTRFNTQPPEGGWIKKNGHCSALTCFNTQPPEGGWERLGFAPSRPAPVSTHSRLKAAGPSASANTPPARRFQHTAA